MRWLPVSHAPAHAAGRVWVWVVWGHTPSHGWWGVVLGMGSCGLLSTLHLCTVISMGVSQQGSGLASRQHC